MRADPSSPGAHMVLAGDDFETEAGSLEEDEVRRQALQDYMPILSPVGWANIGAVLRQAATYVVSRPLPRLDRRRALALVRKLDPVVESKQATLAPAVTMRIIRVEVIGALIDAVADVPGEELCTVTMVKPA